MIPICLITGFLGSGKTTLLKRCIDQYRGRRIVYLVNEFSPRDVDGVLLRGKNTEVVSLAGGSIFCRCLVTDFMAALRDIPQKLAATGAPIEGIVIEASGMANPRVAGTMLKEAKLDSIYQLATILCVVDPGSFPKLLHTLPAVRSQVEAADIVLLNKTDIYSTDIVISAETALRTIHPAAKILRTSFCSAPVDLFKANAPHPVSGEYAKCRDPNFETFTIPMPGPLNMSAFQTAVEAIRDDIYRIKGFVIIHGQRQYLDYSASGFHSEDAPVDGPLELVLILRGPATPAAQALLKAMQNQVFSRSAESQA